MALGRGELSEIAPDTFGLIWSSDDSVRGGYGANQGFLVLENSVLIFDSGLSLLQARSLDASIRKVTDKKVKYVVNSHDHSDHVFGNYYFWKKYSRDSLTIISHEICRDNLRRLGPRRLEAYVKMQGMEIYLEGLETKIPDMIFSDTGLRLELEGRKLVLSHPPTGAHTLGDTVLFLPQERTIYAGDVIWNHFLPNLEDANLEGWISFLEDFDLGTYEKIVPGHGGICGPEEVLEFLHYLKQVRANLLAVNLEKISNSNIEALRNCFLISGTEDWKLKSIVEHNVNAIFIRKSGT